MIKVAINFRTFIAQGAPLQHLCFDPHLCTYQYESRWGEGKSWLSFTQIELCISTVHAYFSSEIEGAGINNWLH